MMRSYVFVALDAIGRAIDHAALALWVWRQHPGDRGICAEMSIYCLSCTRTYECNHAVWPEFWKHQDDYGVGTGWGLYCMLRKKFGYCEHRDGLVVYDDGSASRVGPKKGQGR